MFPARMIRARAVEKRACMSRHVAKRSPCGSRIRDFKAFTSLHFLTTRRSKHAIRLPGLRCACLPCSTYCSSTPARAKRLAPFFSTRLAPSLDGPLTHCTSPRGEKCRLGFDAIWKAPLIAPCRRFSFFSMGSLGVCGSGVCPEGDRERLTEQGRWRGGQYAAHAAP